MYIILQTTGKNDSVDTASVHIFSDYNEALAFELANTSQERKKYWTKCEFTKEGKNIELVPPTWD